MKKSILLVITILMMIFGITKVNALNYDYTIDSTNLKPFNSNKNFSIIYASTSINNGLKTYEIDFDNNITSTHQFIKFSYSILNTSSYYTNYNDLTYSWQRDYIEFIPIIGIVDNTNTLTKCEYDSSTILCPSNGKPYTKMRFYYIDKNSPTQNGASLDFVILATAYQVDYANNNSTQQIINNQNQNATTISNNITNLNDNITSSTISSQTTSYVGNISSNNINTDSKNVVLDFMLMPITFIQNILNSFGNSCATLCIGNCNSGHDNEWFFVFPCVDVKSYVGDTIYNTIDVLMCFGMVFAFLRSVVGFLKKALLLESDISSEVRIF